MSILRRFAKALTSSKKAMASVVTGIIALVAPTARRHGVDITPEVVEQIIVVGSAYVVGQGIADHGKEAARVNMGITK